MILIMGTVITDIFLKSMCDVIYVYVSEKERNLATEGAIVNFTDVNKILFVSLHYLARLKMSYCNDKTLLIISHKKLLFCN